MIRTGLGRVVAFNWPKYVVALLFLFVSLVFAASSKGLLLVSLVVGSAAVVYGVFASLLATWWVYDHKAADLYQTVASEYQPGAPWILVHAGLDESQGRLDALIGPAASRFDVGPTADHSPSLRRAHRLVGRDGELWNGSLALQTGSVGFAVVLFGIHELSVAAAETLLGELQRVVAVGGTVVIVEHLRDVPNALVFGPAALHFASGHRWKTGIDAAGLVGTRSQRIAGFVTVFCAESVGIQT
jgi:hypothetical protein